MERGRSQRNARVLARERDTTLQRSSRLAPSGFFRVVALRRQGDLLVRLFAAVSANLYSDFPVKLI